MSESSYNTLVSDEELIEHEDYSKFINLTETELLALKSDYERESREIIQKITALDSWLSLSPTERFKFFVPEKPEALVEGKNIEKYKIIKIITLKTAKKNLYEIRCMIVPEHLYDYHLDTVEMIESLPSENSKNLSISRNHYVAIKNDDLVSSRFVTKFLKTP